jgi:hypothetical protein
MHKRLYYEFNVHLCIELRSETTPVHASLSNDVSIYNYSRTRIKRIANEPIHSK